MSYFGRKAKKPGSVPGSQSGGPETDAKGKLSGLVRKVSAGRQARASASGRTGRQNRTERRA